MLDWKEVYAPPLPASTALTTRAGTERQQRLLPPIPSSSSSLSAVPTHPAPRSNLNYPIYSQGANREGLVSGTAMQGFDGAFLEMFLGLFWRESPGFWWQLAPCPALPLAAPTSYCIAPLALHIVTTRVTQSSPSPSSCFVTTFPVVAKPAS